jgi:hypothetical protein
MSAIVRNGLARRDQKSAPPPLMRQCTLPEAYTIAFHRLAPAATDQESDYISGLRYLDRHTRREGKWRIVERRCIYEWSRVEPFDTGSSFPDGYAMGRLFPDDVVYTMLAETIES